MLRAYPLPTLAIPGSHPHLQVLLLAFVGVVIASLLTAVVIMWLQPDWQFNVCWMIGTILSATDPVAVVALLKVCRVP